MVEMVKFMLHMFYRCKKKGGGANCLPAVSNCTHNVISTGLERRQNKWVDHRADRHVTNQRNE